MPNLTEIQNRIRSVKDTQKITNAMYLIASTKMKKAKREQDLTQPYNDALHGEIKRLFRSVEKVDSQYFYPEQGEPELDGQYGCLIITADKGLAGAYNQNVLKEGHRLYEKHDNLKLFVVGEYGRQYFHHHNIEIAQSFLYTAQNPTVERAREIASVLLEQYNSGELQKIYVVYTNFENTMCTDAICERLLPFHHNHFYSTPEEKEMDQPIEFLPSPGIVLNNMIESYITGFIYVALVESFCSEQNARMTAMNAANQNAEKILSELDVLYHRVRQAAITQEITEVSAGAQAQKKKKKSKEVS